MALYIGGVAVDATAAEIDVLDGLDRGSIIYGNASSVTSILDQGGADEVLTSDGTDIAWAAAGAASFDTAITINDSQGDNDFRVEGDDEEYLLFCDASEDSVGIGTSSPVGRFTVATTAVADVNMYLQTDGTGYTDSDGLEIFMRYANDFGGVHLREDAYFAIAVNGDTRMSVLPNGKVGIGTTTPGGRLEVKGIESADLLLRTEHATDWVGFQFYRNTDRKFLIQVNNDAGGDYPDHNRYTMMDSSLSNGVYIDQGDNSWSGITSDERKKTNWNMFEDALGKINTLSKIGSYQQKDPITNEILSENKRGVGLSAQEVQEILPDSIKLGKRHKDFNDDTEYLSFPYQDVFVLMVKAVQELSAKVEALENA